MLGLEEQRPEGHAGFQLSFLSLVNQASLVPFLRQRHIFRSKKKNPFCSQPTRGWMLQGLENTQKGFTNLVGHQSWVSQDSSQSWSTIPGAGWGESGLLGEAPLTTISGPTRSLSKVGSTWHKVESSRYGAENQAVYLKQMGCCIYRPHVQRRNAGQTTTRKADGYTESKAQFSVTGNISLATLTVWHRR